MKMKFCGRDNSLPFSLYPFRCSIRNTNFADIEKIFGPNGIEYEPGDVAFYVTGKSRWIHWEGYRTKTEADAVYMKLIFGGKR
jgi:hypothetical protein